MMRVETFLPSIHSAPTMPTQGEDDKARQLFALMVTHKQQRRKHMRWDERLAWVAEDKCKAQALRGWDGHVDPDGLGPNYWVRQLTPYQLPDYSHAEAANNIESLAHGGDGSIEGTYGVWDAWMGSDGHRTHLLGLDSTFATQTQVGIGYYAGGTYRHYWAIITCPPEER